MKIRKYSKKISLIIITSVIVVSSLGFFIYNDENDFKILKNLEIFSDLFREINQFYVDETDPEKLITSSIEGMLEKLDPYTDYIPESNLDDLRFITTGKYGGIGALIRKRGEYAMISDSYENFPADRAGFKTGDIIIEVDAVSTKGKTLTEISDMLKGLPNTPIEIAVKRTGINNPIKKSLIREIIKISSVPYYGMIDDNTGYIRYNNFPKDSHLDVKDALLDLKNNMGARSVILDLRGNPGGLLIEAVHVANIFINKGEEIVSTKGKLKNWDNTFKTQYSAVDEEIPLAVLVNRSSASSAEIVAGAMQDLDRAIIIGQRTYGKGLVQTTRPLPYNGQLKITTAKYYIPSGRCIQALDYSNRNEDGSVGSIPDTLITEFITKNGRKVFDGGGIVPDIEMKPEPLSMITLSLYSKSLLFNYATEFASKNSSIPPVKEFTFSDSDYNNFLEYIKDKDYDYQTQSEEHLKELIKSAKKEKYYSVAVKELEALQDKLKHDKNKDLQLFRDEIIELLSSEIVGRYYYQGGRIESTLKHDQQIQKAIELLNDSDQYFSILNTSEIKVKADSEK